jgi:hypothetical protein
MQLGRISHPLEHACRIQIPAFLQRGKASMELKSAVLTKFGVRDVQQDIVCKTEYGSMPYLGI